MRYARRPVFSAPISVEPLPPSQFEAGFLSTVHSDDDIARTLTVVEDGLTTTDDLPHGWRARRRLTTDQT